MKYEESISDGVGEQTVIVEGSRLASLILLAILRRRFLKESGEGTLGAKVVFTGVETDNLRYLIENYGEKWTRLRPLFLWALVLGACEAMRGGGQTAEWYCGMVKRVMDEMGLREWEEIVSVVGGFFWVSEVMDEDCEELGRRVKMLG